MNRPVDSPVDPAPRPSLGMPSAASIRRLVWLSGLSHAVNHYVMLIFPAVLLLLQREYGLGFAALGLIANLGLFGYGLGALPAGILADRWGGTRLLAVWLVGGSLACALMALSTGPAGLAAGYALLGLFASLHHPAGSGILALVRHVPGQEMGRAFGLSGLLGNLGLAASPLVSAMVGSAWGWRAALWVGAVPGLLLGPALWCSPLPRPPASGGTTGAFHPGSLAGAGRALTLPLLLLFALETLMGFIFQGFSTFFPAHLAERAQIPGLSAAQVTRGGTLASLALLLGGTGHWLAGRLAGSRHRAAGFRTVMAVCMLSLFAMAGVTGPGLVLVSVAMTLSYFALGTLSNTFIAAETPTHLASTAFGVTFTLAFCVGSLAAGSMGLVAERAGLPAVFAVLGLVGVGCLGLVVWFTRVSEESPARPAR